MDNHLESRHARPPADDRRGFVAAAQARQPSSAVVARLGRAAAAGDERAWEQLVERFDGKLRTVARGYRLNAADVDDVVQSTWLRALRHIGQLRDPGAFGAWLVVMLRREALRLLQRGVREVLTDAPGDLPAAEPSAEDGLIEGERAVHVHEAVSRLSGRQRQLMSSLLAPSAPSYELLADRLEMPLGSVGPTRERALRHLRRDVRLRQAIGR